MLSQRPQLEQSLYHVFAFFLHEWYTLHGRRKAYLRHVLLRRMPGLQIYVYLGSIDEYDWVPDYEMIEFIMRFF